MSHYTVSTCVYSFLRHVLFVGFVDELEKCADEDVLPNPLPLPHTSTHTYTHTHTVTSAVDTAICK